MTTSFEEWTVLQNGDVQGPSGLVFPANSLFHTMRQFVTTVESTMMENTQEETESVLEENETWSLEFSYGSPGLSLGASYTPCNSLEECKAQFAYMVEHCGMPRWADAVHNIDKVMQKTIVLKLLTPDDLDLS